jgi:hypothetical protein
MRCGAKKTWTYYSFEGTSLVRSGIVITTVGLMHTLMGGAGAAKLDV